MIRLIESASINREQVYKMLETLSDKSDVMIVKNILNGVYKYAHFISTNVRLPDESEFDVVLRNNRPDAFLEWSSGLSMSSLNYSWQLGTLDKNNEGYIRYNIKQSDLKQNYGYFIEELANRYNLDYDVVNGIIKTNCVEIKTNAFINGGKPNFNIKLNIVDYEVKDIDVYFSGIDIEWTESYTNDDGELVKFTEKHYNSIAEYKKEYERVMELNGHDRGYLKVKTIFNFMCVDNNEKFTVVERVDVSYSDYDSYFGKNGFINAWSLYNYLQKEYPNYNFNLV